jgi:hypothetical protein
MRIHLKPLLLAYILCLLSIAGITSTSAKGVSVTPVQPQGNDGVPTFKQGTMFYPVSDLSAAQGELALRGARAANPKDWPATFYSVHAEGSCTSTLVGPRTLLTAAHCIGSDGKVTLTVGDQPYRGTCTIPTEYATNKTADWALCLIERDVPVQTFETLDLDSKRLKKEQEILLTGFGCTSSEGTGGNDGVYRIGEAIIKDLPQSTINDIRTDGGAALCFGDSGGPAFLFLDPAKERRIQVSVNSRVERLPSGGLGQQSYLSSLSTPGAKKFIQGWASSNHALICGVSQGASKCRS